MQTMIEAKLQPASEKTELIKAVAVIPGRPNSIHLRAVPQPKVTNIRGGGGCYSSLPKARAASRNYLGTSEEQSTAEGI